MKPSSAMHKAGLAISAATLIALTPAVAQPKKQTETVFVAMCRDKANAQAERSALIGKHLDYIDRIKDRVAVGGPSYAIGGAAPHGSVIVYHAATLEEAKQLLQQDPLFPVFETCGWDAFSAYVGTYVGGWVGRYRAK